MIYKMALFLEAQVKEKSCSAWENFPYFVFCMFHLRGPGMYLGEGFVCNNVIRAQKI